MVRRDSSHGGEDEIGMASLRQVGDNFYVRIKQGRKSAEISLGEVTRRDAERMRQQYQADLETGRYRLPSRTLISEALPRFIEHLRQTERHTNYMGDVSRLRMCFGSSACRELIPPTRGVSSAPTSTMLTECETLEQIGVMELSRFFEAIGRRVTPKTVNAYRDILSRLYEFARLHLGYVDPTRAPKNPALMLPARRSPATPIRYMRPGDITRLLEGASAQPMLRAAIALMIYGGLRREEAVWLEWEDVDFDARVLRVQPKTNGATGERWTGKSRKAIRTVPISGSLRDELMRWRRFTRFPTFGWVLYSPLSETSPRAWRPDSITAALKKFMTRTPGVGSWTCNEFRHTFASLLAQRNVALARIAEWMGHDIVTCSRYYAHLLSPRDHEDAEFMGGRDALDPPDDDQDENRRAGERTRK